MSGGAGDHAALMDKVYRRQRHFYDFTRKYFLFGRDRLLRELRARPGERIVEIGCGTARNLIRIARHYPGVHLYGIDASREMLRSADAAVRGAGLASVRFAHGLAEEMAPACFGLAEPFDHAIFSYSLSMIPDWRRALVAAAGAVREDGYIHVVDFGDLKGLWPPTQRGLKSWLKLFHVVPREELLGAIEQSTQAGHGPSLRLLPGRYAFIIKARPSQIRRIAAGAQP